MYNSDFKQSYAWDQYLTYTDYVARMYQFATDYPDICQVFSIGQTVEGRELLVARISDNIDQQEEEPQFLYTGQIHGDELATSILLLRLIDELTSAYGANAQITRLVNNVDIWINPMANPDGTYAGGNNTVNGATRYNANAIDLNRNFPDPQDGQHPDGNAWQAETQLFMQLAENQHFVMSANTHGGTTVVNYPWDTWYTRHADDDWWQLVSHEYADTAQYYSPAGYMENFDDGITNGYDWYTVSGGRQDYMNYFHHCREFIVEQSVQKMLPAADLPAYWEYNRQAMLNYLEQITFGFSGQITDAETGNPISGAKIEIAGHDNNQSFVLTNSNGYYYRPIKSGTYNLTFSADGYLPKTKYNQTISDYESVVVSTSLQKDTAGLDENNAYQIHIQNPVQAGILSISTAIPVQELSIYNLMGQKVFQQNVNNTRIASNIAFLNRGIYIVQLKFGNGATQQYQILVP